MLNIKIVSFSIINFSRQIEKKVYTNKKNRIDLDHADMRFNYFEKVYYFLSAPVIKFVYDKVQF